MSDELDRVFSALADPTRRQMVQALLRDGTTSIPVLTADLPISRQAVAKHIASLDSAGLIERAPAQGRRVLYQLRPGAIAGAAQWLETASAQWDRRLAALKDSIESRRD